MKKTLFGALLFLAGILSTTTTANGQCSLYPKFTMLVNDICDVFITFDYSCVSPSFGTMSINLTPGDDLHAEVPRPCTGPCDIIRIRFWDYSTSPATQIHMDPVNNPGPIQFGAFPNCIYTIEWIIGPPSSILIY
jgi:hypothetical protein